MQQRQGLNGLKYLTAAMFQMAALQKSTQCLGQILILEQGHL
jgi:hypothetical protein